MKKMVSFLLALALLFSFAMAEVPDLSSLSYQELRDLRAQVIAEMQSRYPVESQEIRFVPGKSSLLVNSEGVQIYFTGRMNVSSYSGYYVMQIAVNNESRKALSFWAKNLKLNGWNLSGSIITSTLKTGEKVADDFTIKYTDALLNSADEMKELTFSLVAEDENYSTVFDFGEFRILFGEE